MASQSQTFSYTGAQQTFVVPTGVTSIQVDVQGAAGLTGGNGGRVQATLSVTAGETLNIYVGQNPTGTTGGFNGGGNSGSGGNAGGGASDIRQGGSALSNRKVVAGGGGGRGVSVIVGGQGSGGYATGATGDSGGFCDYYGCYTQAFGGGGGTQSAGGVGGTGGGGTAGSAGSSGQGGAGAATRGGGGGGGYFGGGGGESTAGSYGGGGGGGSNFTAASGVTNITHTSGYKSGNGQVSLYWYVPSSNLNIRGGSFAKITATGSQAITGLGFTPKTIVFWASGSATYNSFGNSAYQIFGITAGSSNSAAVGSYSAYAATSDTSSRSAAKAITMPTTDGTGTLFEADLTSFDSDGFTLNWTTNAAPAEIINYLAIGGTDVSAKVVTWTTPTSTGNKAVTGVGFQPDLVLHASDFTATALPASNVGFSHGIGAMNTTGQWSTAAQLNDAATSGLVNAQRSDACLVQINSSQTVQYQASYVSMGSDGFTTNFSTTQGTARQVISLCLRGLSSSVSFFDKSTSVSLPVSQAITGTGFQTKAVLMSSTQLTTTTATGTETRLAIGGSSGPSLIDSNTGATAMLYSSWVYSYGWQYQKAFAKVTGASSVNALADLSSLDSNGFTLSWTTNDAVATRIFYVAMGDQVVVTASTRTHQMMM